MKNALSDFLQIWGFEKDAIVFSDGSLGFALELTPLDVTCWSVGQINDFSSRVIQFLNGLSDNIDLQFVQDITSGNSDLIDRHEQGGSLCENLVVNELTVARAKRLKHLDETRLLPKHVLKLFVRKPPQRALLEKPKFFSKAKLFQAIADDRLVFEIAALERLKAVKDQHFDEVRAAQWALQKLKSARDGGQTLTLQEILSQLQATTAKKPTAPKAKKIQGEPAPRLDREKPPVEARGDLKGQ